MALSFSLIRFVPDPAKGEFVNIGAIAGDDATGDWELRLVSSLKRAKALDQQGVLSDAAAFAAGLQDHIAALEELAPATEQISTALLKRCSSELQNIVQITPPAPIAADSADIALEMVFKQLVLDESPLTFSFEKKHRALGAARKAYKEHCVSKAVRERAPIRSGVFDGTFDFAVHNGRAVQLAQCWSFQLPNQADLAEQVKSWSWVVHELRKSGGEVLVDGSALEIPKDLDIYSVVIPPLPEQASPAYEEAQAAFEEVGVSQVSPEKADELGARAADVLGVAS
ncbi:MAG TPA: DUF3037 domain-containing protein [Solirubrobacterales bacterium]|nr:DUF3037 domain-containing protein [Solirubrobacterales bacterium]